MCGRPLLVLLFSLCLGAGSLSSAQKPVALSEFELKGLIRAVVTAQANCFLKLGIYASLRDLAGDESLAARKNMLNIKDADFSTFGDYELRVVVSSDGHHYLTSLTKENGCGVAIFSTEHAVIYEATALGCQ